jgi:hypothetical protein
MPCNNHIAYTNHPVFHHQDNLSTGVKVSS